MDFCHVFRISSIIANPALFVSRQIQHLFVLGKGPPVCILELFGARGFGVVLFKGPPGSSGRAANEKVVVVLLVLTLVLVAVAVDVAAFVVGFASIQLFFRLDCIWSKFHDW